MILHRIAANEDDIILLGEIAEEMFFTTISIYPEPATRVGPVVYHIWLQGHPAQGTTRDQIYQALDDTYTARRRV